MFIPTKIKLIILVATSIATGWVLNELYNEQNSETITAEPSITQTVTASEPTKVEKSIPVAVVKPLSSTKTEIPTPPKPFVRYTEAIARGMEKTSTEYAAYWRKYVGSGTMDSGVNDQTLEEWADNVCIRYGSRVASKKAYEWFLPLYADFTSYANRNYIAEQAMRPRSSKPMELSEIWEVDDPTKVYELAVREAVKLKCPETALVDE